MIPKSILHDYVSSRVQEGASNKKTTFLSAANEQYLLKTASERAGMGIGCSKATFKRAAGTLARQRGATVKRGGGHSNGGSFLIGNKLQQGGLGQRSCIENKFKLGKLGTNSKA